MDKFSGEVKDVDYWDEHDIELYVALRSSGMSEVGVREVMSSFNAEELNVIKRFVEFYIHYF